MSRYLLENNILVNHSRIGMQKNVLFFSNMAISSFSIPQEVISIKRKVPFVSPISLEIHAEPFRQEPEAPLLNATSCGLQKAFNPRQQRGPFCSGVKLLNALYSFIIFICNRKHI